MFTPNVSRAASIQLPEDRLELARLLIGSAVEPAKLAHAVKQGLRRIEDVATGRIAGLSEDEYRVALR